METGCQNIQLCSTILKIAFSPEAIGPLFLFPMVYVFFQVTEALALIVLFRCHQWFTHKEKGERATHTRVQHRTASLACLSKTNIYYFLIIHK